MLDGVVSRRDRGSEIAPSWLQTCVGRPFSGAVDSHQRLEKELIGQLTALWPSSAHGERLGESSLNLAFGLWLHPFQDWRYVFVLQGRLGGHDDWTVHRVAVGTGSLREHHPSTNEDAGQQDRQFRSSVVHIVKLDPAAAA